MKVNVQGVNIPDEEVQKYIDYVKEKYADREIKVLNITVGKDDYVDLKCEFSDNVPFERVRRITGYLIGTLDRFNDGKRAEEHDRVKHTI